MTSQRFSRPFSSIGRQPSIGVLGEPKNHITTEQQQQQQQQQHDASTTVVTTAATSKSLYNPGATILETSQIEIRAAIPMDDVPVANLRLSVFSHFSPSQQGQFCARSCQAIASRRMRGACCIIATSKEHQTMSSSHPRQPPPYILGSAANAVIMNSLVHGWGHDGLNSRCCTLPKWLSNPRPDDGALVYCYYKGLTCWHDPVRWKPCFCTSM